MGRKRSFKGGIHPPEYKGLTAHKPIEVPSLPERVVIPLSQHTGAPGRVLTRVGERVKTGQKLAEGTAFISSSIHASVSGEVVSIEVRNHPVGGMTGGRRGVEAVEIKSDGLDEWDPGISRFEGDSGELGDASSLDPESVSPDEIKQTVLEAGIVGLGGAAFPTHVKLSPPDTKKIDAYILNGAECEPYLTGDDRLMRERPADVIRGLRLMMRAVGVETGYVGIEENKPEAIAAMREEIERVPGISLFVLRVKYPQGSEKQLIHAVTGRQIPSGGLPMDVGVAINNVGTAVSVAEAVCARKPLIERVVTVTGSGVQEPKNLKVRIGTSFDHLIEFCGGYKGPISSVIMGGPMMGISQYTTDVPVVKGTSGIIVVPRSDDLTSGYGTCIRCGRCVEACPMGLQPYLLGALAENELFERAKETDLLDCMECGSCSYICPAKRPLLHWIRLSKAELRRAPAEAAAR